jgi:hypothetical protein
VGFIFHHKYYPHIDKKNIIGEMIMMNRRNFVASCGAFGASSIFAGKVLAKSDGLIGASNDPVGKITYYEYEVDKDERVYDERDRSLGNGMAHGLRCYVSPEVSPEVPDDFKNNMWFDSCNDWVYVMTFDPNDFDQTRSESINSLVDFAKWQRDQVDKNQHLHCTVINVKNTNRIGVACCLQPLTPNKV